VKIVASPQLAVKNTATNASWIRVAKPTQTGTYIQAGDFMEKS